MKRIPTITLIAVLASIGVACSSEDATDARVEFTAPVPGLQEFGPFEATGGAVDDGVVCARGEGSLTAVEDTAGGGVLAAYEFRCGDGSGTFEIQLAAPPEIVADEALWNQAVDGILDINTPWSVLTGDGRFAELKGDGMSGWTALEPGVGPESGGGVLVVFDGDLSISD